MTRYLILIALLMSGCASTSKQKPCPDTYMVNESELEWNDHDIETMKGIRARGRCEVNTGLKCLKTWVKLGFQNYYAECGNP